jgi:hypothetical protein
VNLQWDFSVVADDLARVVAAAEADLRLEQAVYGLDSLDELPLQSLLANKLGEKYSVAREVHYPSSAGNKLSHRRRCDLVLTRLGRPLRLDSKPASLFDPPDQASPAEALWLEVKVAAQFRSAGVRHGGYGQQWRTAVVEDLKKMEAEPAIREAGLLLLVFTESQAVLDKDLQLFEDVMVMKEVIAGFRQVRSAPILDRMGHSLCTVALWPTIQR